MDQLVRDALLVLSGVRFIRSVHSIRNVVDRGVLQAMWEELAAKVGHRYQLIICYAYLENVPWSLTVVNVKMLSRWGADGCALGNGFPLSCRLRGTRREEGWPRVHPPPPSTGCGEDPGRGLEIWQEIGHI